MEGGKTKYIPTQACHPPVQEPGQPHAGPRSVGYKVRHPLRLKVQVDRDRRRRRKNQGSEQGQLGRGPPGGIFENKVCAKKQFGLPACF